ncbi:5-methyltetrahydrofolate--homocysteine methyltransferase [Kibdelosporangium banguiense]|uniref:Methionine synthase n=1 Tax=Kibdelosporangium banguiense TaxID=1365924 RepID=A0ABS4TNM7_9PSEU|nr:methionine synthase [Kibdelosporangium banguiense]MBP2326014.1 5-methyltetrahydrofolate--homocysteine methyltransferase [Kibdelosporangium banguiense]
MSDFLAALGQRVLVADGAMGTALQEHDLTLDDFTGLEGCNEVLNVTRPDVVLSVHRSYLEAGVDAIETNTFGSNLANLAEYDVPERIYELSYAGAALARQAADEYSAQKPRFVLGSVGPGTKLPTLGHAPFAVLRDAYAEQVRGLLAGGVDVVLVETCQDVLQCKAAIIGAQRAMAIEGRVVPIITHVTVETTGTMLLGTEIGAALTALEPLGIDLIGLNCATGPDEMSEHLRHLSKHARIGVSVMPNAGLPELGPNGAVYPLGPEGLAKALAGFVTEFGVQMVGGCCGTTDVHLRAVVDAVSGLTPAARRPHIDPSVSSLYQAVPFKQDSSVLMIGERTNANGSKAFREAMLEGRFEDCVEIARDQTRDGAHMLDLCVDYVGRDGADDMRQLAAKLATASTLPIMLDSTEVDVLQAGLEHFGGRCAVNSVNYEDGDGSDSRFVKVMDMVREFGATVVALTIDEEGQARTADKKIEIAARLIDDIVGKWGLATSDVIVDTLVFTIATGQEESRRDAIETIAAIRGLKQRYPDVQTTLGLSNVSFGLNPAARQVLNSVFLNECVQAGLDTAIVHASKILPMARIPDEQREVALDLVYDRRAEDYDPLTRFMELFEGVTAASSKASRAEELAALPLFDRLQRRIVDGERNGLEADLDEALIEKPALEIINDTLLSGMKTVGELFGSGQMQLPFVLQSAEVMKTAVAHLEPHMDKTDSAGKGKIVLATVKGDVHDIGKNLVDIILSNNGYDVVNIGIKQPITTILDAAQEHDADVIGMSGLLVKSTVIMKENLQEMNSRGVAERWPVLLGGAALTRAFVENDLTEVYHGDVHYARDAFEGLRLMDTVMAAKRGDAPAVDAEAVAKAAERKARRERALRIAEARRAKEVDEPVPSRSDVATDVPIPAPPFWGSRIVKGVKVADYAAMLDERALFMGQWGLKGVRKGQGPSYEELVETDGRPRMRAWMDRLATAGILAHAALVYGYFPCVAEGDDLVILSEPSPDASERTRFTFPRQPKDRRMCLADFFRPRESGEVDVVGFQVVTMGQAIDDFAGQLFVENAYRDYLEVHGLSVQLTEALAEYWHRRMRQELLWSTGKSVAAEDPPDIEEFFKLGYRGARFSLGYGACPDLEDRAKIVDLLEPDRIGVKLSDEFQLHPEQSTDAIVLHHPEAKYFNT